MAKVFMFKTAISIRAESKEEAVVKMQEDMGEDFTQGR